MKISTLVKCSALILLLNVFCLNVVAQSSTWTATGNLIAGRHHHTATLLSSGKVLVAGGYSRCSFPAGCTTLNSAEIYDPATGTWSTTAAMPRMRSTRMVVRLQNGRVLFAGGGSDAGTLSSADLYDPITGTWSATGNLRSPRDEGAAVLLPDGKVLVMGGVALVGGNFVTLNTAELYDPATGTWSATGNLNNARLFHTATLMSNGKVLVAGGDGNLSGNGLRSTEIYDSATGTWSLTGDLAAGRVNPIASHLFSGKVLVSSGFNGNASVLTSELYDPATGTWSATGSLSVYRQTATLLPNGKVLATGNDGGSNTTELYDPAIGTWSVGASLAIRRANHTVTLLSNGKVLAAGGADATDTGINSAELYDSTGVAATVSAASYAAEVSSEAIASVFGANLATIAVSAQTLPLPTTLLGVMVKVRDSAGTERDAPLFYVSPVQINYLIPAGTVAGAASVTVIRNGTTTASGMTQVSVVSPGLFSANSDGQGVAAAILIRVKADGTQSFEVVARFDAAQNRVVAVPIDLGPTTDQLFLELYGTGIRGRSSLAAVTATIGGVNVEVLYAGPQGGFAGLDQVNVRLPRALMGRGTVNIALTVDGKAANVITVSVQ